MLSYIVNIQYFHEEYITTTIYYEFSFVLHNILRYLLNGHLFRTIKYKIYNLRIHFQLQVHISVACKNWLQFKKIISLKSLIYDSVFSSYP